MEAHGWGEMGRDGLTRPPLPVVECPDQSNIPIFQLERNMERRNVIAPLESNSGEDEMEGASCTPPIYQLHIFHLKCTYDLRQVYSRVE